MQGPYFRIDEYELERLRNDINLRYPHASDSRKAILLANALWQQLSPFFKHMDTALQQSLTLELFQRTLISNLPLKAEDIHEICAPYDTLKKDTDLEEPSPFHRLGIETTNENLKWHKPKRVDYILLLVIVVLSGYLLITYTQKNTIKSSNQVSFQQFTQMVRLAKHPIEIIHTEQKKRHSLTYMPLNDQRVKALLMQYDSALLQNDYLAVIDEIAQQEDVHPALLISIIGQEQGFVPSNHSSKDKILNNPYNLYGSWEKKQISFRRSTEICCQLINKILSDCPPETQPIECINRTYAEDQAWHIGVTYFYEYLTLTPQE